jgi:Tol biopolymer transport system component
MDPHVAPRRRSALPLTILAFLSGCNAIADIAEPTDKIHVDSGPRGDAEASDGAPEGMGAGGDGPSASNDGSGAGGDGLDASGDGLDAGAGAGGSSGDSADAFATVDGGDADAVLPIANLGTITRVSVSSDGTQGNEASFIATVSGDGQWVAFSSLASNLVPFDSNGKTDIFVHDRSRHETLRASIASNNDEANGDCGDPIVSTDGTWVVFTSAATNLVATAMSGQQQVFAHWLGASAVITEHRSRFTTDWVTEPAASSDASAVAFVTQSAPDFRDTNGVSDVYVASGGRNMIERVSIGSDQSDGGQPNEPNGMSFEPSLSNDANLAAFTSVASNLVDGDTNGVADVFVRNRLARSTVRVSVSSTGEQGNAVSGTGVVSGTGNRVAFYSDASNLVDGDTNNVGDIFVYDLASHKTVRVSVSSSGEQANESSFAPSISGDGRFVAFASLATNLAPDNGAFPGDVKYDDVFVHDLVTGATVRISVGLNGTRANGNSMHPFISANGRVVAFVSDAPNLVLGDTNGRDDIFVFEFGSDFPPADAGMSR